MSSMRDLLEKMDDNYPFAGEKAKPEQIPGDQVRGKEKFDMISPILDKKPKQKPKQHPAHGRLVGGGAAEEYEESVEQIAEQLRKELAEYGAPGTAINTGSSLDRIEVSQLRRDQKAQKAELVGQEGQLNKEIQGLTQQSLAVSKQPMPPVNPQDPASIAQAAAASREKRAQQTLIANQKRALNQQKAQISPYSE